MLVSPGVQVTVTDESFYVSSGPGTVPLVIIATKENKLDSSGTAIAEGTLKENAEKLYLITSQRELLQTFGLPEFASVSGTPLQGYELNEYGLLATHSYMGLANRSFVVRADVDLAQLEPSDVEPTSAPLNGTYWLDLNDTDYGIFEWDGTSWVHKVPTVFSDVTAPEGGLDGDYGVVTSVAPIEYFKRISGVWTELTDASVNLQHAPHTSVPTATSVGDVWIKTTEPNNGADYVVRLYDSGVGQFVEVDAPLYETRDDALLALDPSVGTLFVRYNSDFTYPGEKASFEIWRHNGEDDNVAVGTAVITTMPASSQTLEINGVNVVIPASATLNDVIDEINNAGITGIIASKNADDNLVVTNTTGKDIFFKNVVGTPTTELGVSTSVYTNWDALVYEQSYEEPTRPPEECTLWYNNDIIVDIMVNDGVGSWVDISVELYVQPSEPTSPLTGDLWVDTDQTDEYPVIYRYNGTNWILIDNADQTTPDGIIFADARPDPTSPLDNDAPDPLLYPKDMLLWNMRYSTNHVKKWMPDYTFEGVLIGDRWVTESGLDFDGSPLMGRRAVKKIITEKMASILVDNEEIRSEFIFFNLIATPGFPELIDEMVTLNVDRKEQAFIVADTPFRLKPNGTELQQWASNANNAASNGEDGLITANPYVGVYYPSGLSTNLDGEEVVVPASHMVLRQMAFNDQVAYPWFAPAGYQRGSISNAVSVGYIDDEDEYVPVQLNEGLRDVLYVNNINPIASIPNQGIVIWGQKTRNPVESALDRVNVARLINYIRYQAERLARPFLFEPNDSITRAAVKNAFERFLTELINLRGLTDFAVVVDESNNTPTRIDRNELWIDIAVIPTRAVEFIYIPIRILNTGAL